MLGALYAFTWVKELGGREHGLLDATGGWNQGRGGLSPERRLTGGRQIVEDMALLPTFRISLCE
jgi:hypothetical protein